MTQKLPSYPSCRTILLPRGLPGRQPAGGGARAAGQGEKARFRAPAARTAQSRAARAHSPSGEQVEQGAVLRHGTALHRQAPLLCGTAGIRRRLPEGEAWPARPPLALAPRTEAGGPGWVPAAQNAAWGAVWWGWARFGSPCQTTSVSCGPPADGACSCALNPGVLMLVHPQRCWEKFCSNRLAQ